MRWSSLLFKEYTLVACVGRTMGRRPTSNAGAGRTVAGVRERVDDGRHRRSGRWRLASEDRRTGTATEEEWAEGGWRRRKDGHGWTVLDLGWRRHNWRGDERGVKARRRQEV